MPNISYFKKGSSIIYKNEPYLIIEMNFNKPGKGGAFYKMKLKNLKSFNTLEVTFKSSENLEEANIIYRNTQFLYKEDDIFYFMDLDTYEQFPINQELLGDQTKFFKDGVICKTMFFENKPCSASLPLKMEFKVISTPPGVKGDTASGGTKYVEIETGERIKTPLFIKEGDNIRINTETGEYIERC